MEYQIALPPELGLSSEEFVAGWNDDQDCLAIAEAGLAEPTTKQYDPTLATAALAVLGSVALNVASNAIYDLIKHVLAKKGVRRDVEIMQLDQPDGSRLLVVKIIDA
ncbi:MAG: hypothetical protein ACE5I2_16715 [Anaerolineae bacterium]